MAALRPKAVRLALIITPLFLAFYSPRLPQAFGATVQQSRADEKLVA
jgi:hypothetical protein